MRINQRLKGVLILVVVALFVPLLWTFFYNGADLATFELYERKVAELRDHAQYYEALNRACEEDLINLRRQITLLTSFNRSSSFSQGDQLNNSEIAEIWQRVNSNVNDTLDRLHPASIYTYLPHLLTQPKGLYPMYKVSQSRRTAAIVLGVPTIKRTRVSYLDRTIVSLLDSMDDAERANTLVVVMIAEPFDMAFVKNTSAELIARFPKAIKMGLLEIIAPPPEYYPDFDQLEASMGDTMERVRWRTKQNLDYIFLMLYASSRGQFYVQLEDDVITKPGYISVMRAFAMSQPRKNWLLLEFSQLGFIGKMFKAVDVPRLVEFFLIFYRDKPIDWLLDHYLSVKVCSPEKDMRVCRKAITEIRRSYKPSLFQHIGTYSSLDGKVQKLKDKYFGRRPQFNLHINPNAMLSTSLQVYQRFSLDRAYLKETYFWSNTPKQGDFIQMHFSPPVYIDGYKFRSGDADHPSDRIYSASLEIKSLALNNMDQSALTKDGFLPINKFFKGDCIGQVPYQLLPVEVMKIRFLSDSDSWVLLNEITITLLTNVTGH